MGIKKLLLIGLSISFVTIGNHAVMAQQPDKKVGLGLMVGEPTGISFKVWTSESNAIDAGLAWSVGRYDAINLHADYLWHDFELLGDEINQGQLPVYYGVGGRIVFADNFPDEGDENALLGVRIPAGINYLFEDAPVGLFLEIAPVVSIIPDTDFDLDSSLGVRYYF